MLARPWERTTIDDATPPSGLRLARYDAAIARHATAAAFALWRDRVLVLLGGMLVIAAWRTWLTDRPPAVQRWAVLALGVFVGFTCGRALIARLRYHAADGPLAPAALRRSSQRSYAAIGHAAAAAALAAAVAIARPALIAWPLIAYLAGAALAHAVPRLGAPAMMRTDRPRRLLATIGGSYRVAAIAVLAFAAVAATAATLPIGARLTAVGIAAGLVMLALTSVDDAVVRFMALAGHGVSATIGRHVPAGALFGALAAAIALPVVGPAATALVLGIGLAVLVWLALRVILYRLYARRAAELVLVGIAAIVGLVAVSLPLALPVLAALVIRHLWRRSAERCCIVA